MKRILVPVDFSDVTPRLIEVAQSIVSAMDGHIILLNVTPPPHLAVGGTGRIASIVSEVKEPYDHLNALQRQIEDSGLSVTVDQPHGSPAEVILQESERESVDMIVMGSHGHGKLYELLAGSVTSGVLKSAKCPVLVVPSRKEEPAEKLPGARMACQPVDIRTQRGPHRFRCGPRIR